jgi:AcrR family transcriptional regulator
MSLAADLAARRRVEAVEQIAVVALGLFERDGFDATSVEAIAAAAGCSPRTFYRYFGAKDDVILYDVPEILDELRRVLDGYLDDGLTPWEAVTETYTRFIGRFDETDPGIPVRRMRLCLSEPTLRTCYLRYIYEAEQVVADRLHRHRGSTPLVDELPQLIAVAATGAYRVTLFTHLPAGDGRKLAEHLRVALAAFASGLGPDASAGVPNKR